MTGDRPSGGASRGDGVAGEVLFARYAYPPNELGYCGPEESATLWSAACGELEHDELAAVRAVAARFEGAWPYFELLAECSGLADPLDASVVEAYWLGGPLLESVPASRLAEFVRDRFAGSPGVPSSAPSAAAAGGVAQHGFHVLAVYPWLELWRRGTTAPALRVLDRCRIRWGTVLGVDGDLATVSCRPLRDEDGGLSLGDAVVEQVRHGAGGRSVVAGLEPGDVVALHWGWVCDRLTGQASASLEACTERNLAAVGARRA